MVFFLYPYFWSHTARWELKKYLDHPDFLHRTFLKSGSARVVMTIRPGFERDFVSFVETGGFDGLDPSHPYMTIAAETEAFAHTNYPGIPAANAVENARPLLSPVQQKAWKEMQGIIALLEEYREANTAYPTTRRASANSRDSALFRPPIRGATPTITGAQGHIPISNCGPTVRTGNPAAKRRTPISPVGPKCP